ncbi:HlyC/CorC family transporter [Ancylobacter mangrovi]|uniref:HlyC/CorC family transporter n=1 Tax=Ancylobacter mangrovi TaxID=2972472 RepID=A0A9X2PEU1_9HYPH|nr:HlyC/CorC family transporter [Ancylobacter mangrovi]MCS0497397.1 HlyC/CorC family transporter [Ancylobacter mangrovi]MCS0504053.1 HlyC/CorC family transporter [Ancylobacter mangrovi]
MTTYDWLALGAVAVCLLLSFFFSGSETALTASSKARMHALEKNGDKRATLVNRMMERRERLIGGILLGNNLVNIAASSLATGLLLAWFGSAGIAYATLGMTIIVVIFSEVLPKTIALNHPDSVSLMVARPIRAIVSLFGPLTLAIEALVRALLGAVGVPVGKTKSVLTAAEELRGAVDLLHREGSVVKDERDMLGGLLDLGELEVSDIMVHRTKMASLNADEPPEKLVNEVLASPFTRLPLWRERPDNIVGVLHAKDLLRELRTIGNDIAGLDIEKIALPAWFVPDVTSLADQLKAFRRRKQHFALVVDEYGEVMGLVTLEDILEEIVGDISDEHDKAFAGARRNPDGSVSVEGSMAIRDLNRAMGWELPDEEATTIAGLVIHEARIIPEPGQAFIFHGFRFQVMRKQRNRITLLRVSPLPRPA